MPSSRARGKAKGARNAFDVCTAFARQSGRRMSPYEINEKITTAAMTGREQLIAAVETHLAQMNLVNLSTALHRLAKCAVDRGTDQAMTLIIELLRRDLSTALAGDPPVEAGLPQCLTNIAWSAATLQLQDARLLNLVGTVALANMTFFKAFEIASLLWGFAKSGGEQAGITCTRNLFRAGADRCLEVLEDFVSRSLATAVWAFATAKQGYAKLFRAFSVQIRLKVAQASCQEIANIAWAYATAGHRDPALCNALAEAALPRLEQFKGQEISNLLWGFAINEFFHERIFTASLKVVRAKALMPQHLANIIWACARAKPEHQALQEGTIALMPRCSQAVREFKPQEVASIVQALSRMFEIDRQEDCHLHPDVKAFLADVSPVTISNAKRFSEQSLGNIVKAFAMFDVEAGAEVISAMEHEACYRAGKLKPQELMPLMKSFLCGHGSARLDRAIQVLAGHLLSKFDGFRAQDMTTLTTIAVSSGYFPEWKKCPARGELHRWLGSLAREATQRVPTSMKQRPIATKAGAAVGQEHVVSTTMGVTSTLDAATRRHDVDASRPPGTFAYNRPSGSSSSSTFIAPMSADWSDRDYQSDQASNPDWSGPSRRSEQATDCEIDPGIAAERWMQASATSARPCRPPAASNAWPFSEDGLGAASSSERLSSRRPTPPALVLTDTTAYTVKNSFIDAPLDDPGAQSMEGLRQWASSFSSEPVATRQTDEDHASSASAFTNSSSFPTSLSSDQSSTSAKQFGSKLTVLSVKPLNRKVKFFEPPPCGSQHQATSNVSRIQQEVVRRQMKAAFLIVDDDDDSNDENDRGLSHKVFESSEDSSSSKPSTVSFVDAFSTLVEGLEKKVIHRPVISEE